MWYLSSLIRDQTHTPCMRRQSFKHWTTREVQHQFLMLETSVDLGPVASGSSQNWFQEFVIPPALQVIFCMLKFEKHCSRESVTSKLGKKKKNRKTWPGNQQFSGAQVKKILRKDGRSNWQEASRGTYRHLTTCQMTVINFANIFIHLANTNPHNAYSSSK